MCGIFGYIGSKSPLTTCIEGLKKLEYRGYDSAGIAGIYQNRLIAFKKAGKISQLEKIISSKIQMDVAISHTRWATHGKPNTINAHPHSDQNNTLAIVHNGIIENHDFLKKSLEIKGCKFHTDTDTEVLACLISNHYKKDFLQAVKEALKEVKGSFAVACIHKDFPDQIITAAKESPIAIGYNEDQSEILIASDPNAFLGYNLNVFYLHDHEIAVIKKNSITVFDKNEKKIIKKTEKIEGKNIAPSKNGFEHFMLKEIYEQPFTIQKAMTGHISEIFGTADFKDINFSTKELMATKHILLIACGTSWHAGLIGASLLEEMARIPTQAEIASELRYKNPIISEDTLVIAISQSGETADTIAAVKEAKAKGAKILGICNVKNSTLFRESDSCIFLQAGPEISVCSTKAFTSQITVLSLFSLFMARLRHMKKEEGQIFINEIKQIPAKIKKILENAPKLQKLAEKYAQYDNFFFLGRKYMYPTCLEAALKLKEISYLNANGYPAGELKHGPIALISSTLPVIAFCSNRQTYDKMLSNLMESKARGAPILAFASFSTESIENIADDIFYLPSTIDELAPFPASVAGQLFAYYVAKKRNREIDQPRNLAKSVTVE